MKKYFLLIIMLTVIALMIPADVRAGGLDSVLGTAKQEAITGEDNNKGTAQDTDLDSCLTKMMQIERIVTSNFLQFKFRDRVHTEDGECYMDFASVTNNEKGKKICPELVCDKADKNFLGAKDKFTYYFHFVNAVMGDSRQYMFNVNCKIHGKLHATDIWFDPAKFVQKNPKCLANMKTISGAVLGYYGKYKFRGRAYTEEGECYLDFVSMANNDLKEDIFVKFICPDASKKDIYSYFFYFKKVQKNVIKFNVYCKNHGKFFAEDLPFTVSDNGDVTVIMGSQSAEVAVNNDNNSVSETAAAEGALAGAQASAQSTEQVSGSSSSSGYAVSSSSQSSPGSSNGSTGISGLTGQLQSGRISDNPAAASSSSNASKEDYWSHAVNLAKEGFQKGDFDRVLIGGAQTIAALPGKLVQTNGDMLKNAGTALRNCSWMKEQEAKQQNFIPRAAVTAVGAGLQVAGTVQSFVGKAIGTVATVGGRLVEKLFPWSK